VDLAGLASKAEQLAEHLRAAAELRAELGLGGAEPRTQAREAPGADPPPPQMKQWSQAGVAERARKREARQAEGKELARELVKLCGSRVEAAKALKIDPCSLKLYLKGSRAPRQDRLELLRRTVERAREVRSANFAWATPPGQEDSDGSPKRSSAA